MTNAKRARADRAADQQIGTLTEGIAQAHNALHRDDTPACHDFLHQALGLPTEGHALPVATLTHLRRFDAAFIALCQRHGISASYIAIDPVHERDDGASRLMSGGDAYLSQLTDRALRSLPQQSSGVVA